MSLNSSPTNSVDVRVVRRVVIDTNIFFTDLLLRGANWSKLLLLLREGFIELYFPEIVVREMARHFGRKHRNDLNAVINAVEEIRAMDRAVIDLGVSLPDVDKAALRRCRDRVLEAEVYQSELRTKLQESGVQVLALPQVDVQDLVDAYLSARKPFKANDAGVADYLIWETVRGLLGYDPEDSMVVLVTENTSDFTFRGELHPDLVATLTPPAEVIVATSVDGLLAAHEKHFREIETRENFDYSEQANELALGAAQNFVQQQLAGTSISSTNFEPHPSGVEIEGLVLPVEIESPMISWIELEDSPLEWQPYESLNGTTELGVLECQGEMSITGIVHRSEAFDLQEHYDVQVSYFDIAEDHYADVELTRRVRLRLNVRVEMNNSAEVMHLEQIAAD